MDHRNRHHVPYWGFVLHRVSGVGLALFLPVHFLALSTAILGEAHLDAFLVWTEHPLLKLAETVLVVLLAVHLAGGLRVMALEFAGWRERQKDMVAASLGVAVLFGLGFLLSVF